MHTILYNIPISKGKILNLIDEYNLNVDIIIESFDLRKRLFFACNNPQNGATEIDFQLKWHWLLIMKQKYWFLFVIKCRNNGFKLLRLQ